MHLVDNLVSPVHREVNVDVRFQTESSQMVERDGEPLQRIVEMWKRAVGFLSLFEAPNLPEIPLELLLREPRHSVLPLQRVHLQVKVEILFRLNISFSLIRALRISSRRFSSRKFTKEFHWTRSPNLVSSIIPSQLFASSCVILLREIDEFNKKERKKKRFVFASVSMLQPISIICQ